MMFAADRLADWDLAQRAGALAAGRGDPVPAYERARMADDFTWAVTEAEGLVREFTGLAAGRVATRAWTMSRADWVRSNLRGFQIAIEPVAARLTKGEREDGPAAAARRAVLGAQIGGLLGYVARRVLGQYDLFLPPDDEGLLYFVGPNIADVERKYGFPGREFRLWIALHEVTHRVQLGGVRWLAGYIQELLRGYLDGLDLEPGAFAGRIARALEEARHDGGDWRDVGWISLLMTADQREVVRKVQALMTLLEGHASFVMNRVAPAHVPQAALFDRRLNERRQARGIDRAFRRLVGFEAKVRQYAAGERFVTAAVERAGMDGFNAVWSSPANLPTLEEIARPEDWTRRVAGA